MLLVGVLLSVPVYEAFACSFEPATHVQGVEVAEETSDSGGATDHSHGLCGHNHCHHTTANVPEAIVLSDATRKGNLAWALSDDSRPSSATDGLLRPPRI